jgi:putative tryptophan/tyrosine transport system substrate-binding protein
MMGWCSAVGFIVTLTLSMLAAPLTVEAQPPSKVSRLGIRTPAAEASTPLWEAFRQGLRDLGYVEGKNIALEYRFAAGQNERLPALAAELVHLPVDMIVTNSGAAAQAARNATETIPIAMAASGDPVRIGVVASLAQPGGNITGLSLMVPEVGGKRLELLKEALPHVSRVAVLWNAANPASPDELRAIEAAARVLGLQLHALAVGNPDELDSVFAAMTREGAEAFITLADAVLWNRRTRVVALAAQHHLPAMFDAREFADAGGLMAYGPHVPDSYRRAAVYVDKILKGAQPADLPVERPVKFELVINLKTAKALGITIPPHLLLLEDEVLQ